LPDQPRDVRRFERMMLVSLLVGGRRRDDATHAMRRIGCETGMLVPRAWFARRSSAR
jgi:hypothetical protein